MSTNLRVATASLLIVFLFVTRVNTERAALRQSLSVIEANMVTAMIARASADDVRPFRDLVVLDGLSFGQLVEGHRVYGSFRHRGDVYALGQMRTRVAANVDRRIAMIGGGDLYYLTDSSDRTTKPYKDLLQRHDYTTLPPTRSADAQNAEDRVFFLPIIVVKNESAPSDLVNDGFRFVATNFEIAYGSCPFPDKTCIRAGKQVHIIRDGASKWDPLQQLTADDLDSESLRLARRVGVVSEDVRRAYLEARARYESGKANLPFIGEDVAASRAVAGGLVLSIALLAWLSYLLRAIRLPGSGVREEPPGAPALASIWRHVGWWERIPLSAEFVIWTAFQTAGLVVPTVLLITTEWTTEPFFRSHIARVAIVAVNALLLASAAHNYAAILLRSIQNAPARPLAPDIDLWPV